MKGWGWRSGGAEWLGISPLFSRGGLCHLVGLNLASGERPGDAGDRDLAVHPVQPPPPQALQSLARFPRARLAHQLLDCERKARRERDCRQQAQTQTEEGGRLAILHLHGG